MTKKNALLKRGIVFVATLVCMLSLFSVSLFADTLYVSDVVVCSGENRAVAEELIGSYSGYEFLTDDSQNLNAGCSENSNVAFLGYKTTTDKSQAITGLYLSSRVVDSNTYFDYALSPVSGTWSTSQQTEAQTDACINIKVGTDSTQAVYLCYTKDTAAGNPITAIKVATEITPETVIDIDETFGNLNSFNASADELYLQCVYNRSQGDVGRVGTVVSDGGVWLISIIMAVICGLAVFAGVRHHKNSAK